MVRTTETAVQTDEISWAAQKEGPGRKKGKREQQGCCSLKRFSLMVALVAVLIGVYKKQDYISQELLPAMDPYLDPVRQVLPDHISEHVTLIRNGTDGEEYRPGLDLKKQGLRPKFPVVVIPGFVTSGLELWQGHECAKQYFRQRIWGSLGMTRSFFNDIRCWMTHMALHEDTGLDPEGVKLRAAAGLEAVDFFMPGYHVWAKIIEALADVGYDANSIVGETYDWRLGVPNLEVRDGYFTRLKRSIEVTHHLHGEKVFAISHSWGDNVFRNFLLWATEDNENWVDEHIAHYANIAGPTLGVPKSVSSFLSGETRDTASLGFIAAIMSDHMIPRNERVQLFRTWGAGVGMLPVGGPDVWGNATSAPDDPPEQRNTNSSYGSFITEYRVDQELAQKAENESTSLQTAVMRKLRGASIAEMARATSQHDIAGSMELLLNEADDKFAERVHRFGAVHVDHKKRCVCKHGSWEKYYFNPLKCPLPKAPSLKLYCMYGHGMPTERAYSYLNLETPEVLEVAKGEGKAERQRDVLWKINAEVHEENGTLDHGIRLVDGDGTVPLISLGALCARHWRDKGLNPSGIEVVSREYRHEPENRNIFDIRGGGKSADHVDVLSHVDVLRDLVLIATGQGGDLGDKIDSNIREIAGRIPLGAE